MPLPITETLIQRQINHWNRMRAYLKEAPESIPGPPAGPVVTISRQIGSGGRTLAQGLAERLGLGLQDQSLMERIARDQNLSRSLLAQLDEASVNQADLWVRGVLSRRIFLRDQFHGALAQTITRLAARGGVVFLGRGAHLILGENATLRVRVVASRQNRLERLRRRLDVSRAEARAVLTETDRKRDDFIRQVFHQEPDSAESFDLTLNTDRLTPEAALETVMLALLDRQTQARTRSEQAAGG